jgi:6-pyruvoyltetrahydropterin/6-carboxytetrahydropterin synthase
MTRLTQETTFSAAHRLLNYEGSCKNLHGHIWACMIEIESDRKLDKCGMFLDYRTIKQYVKDHYDHCAILNMDDPLVDILKDMNLAVTIINGNPTAENLAKKILLDIVLLADLDPDNDDYARVVIHESADNSAEECL